MGNTNYLTVATLILFVTVFITRALPFLFTKQMRGNALFQYLSERLPLCIIFLLVPYYIISMSKPHNFTTLPWHLIALAVTVLVQWKWKNMLLSLGVGTSVFLLLN